MSKSSRPVARLGDTGMPSFRMHGDCAEYDPDTWFDKVTWDDAKAICGGCDVRAECFAWSIAVAEPYGVWGGVDEDEREKLLGRRGVQLGEAS